MEGFIEGHKGSLLFSLVLFILIIALKVVFTSLAKKVGKLSDFNPVRTNLIIKYINIVLTTLAVIALTFIWGVNYRDLAVLLSSVFAVIGVALFAQWSILSNITAGVIIFFSFPFKIGNTIRILDKEILDSDNPEREVFVIEDIKAFHLHLRKANGEIITYPNNLVLQKGVVLIATYKDEEIDTDKQNG